MAFILNRRAKLRASAIPVEIPDATNLVKKTDKATASKLGLVKIGDNVNVSSGGAISVPVGSSETAGVYKVGEGLSVDENGALSATGGGGGVTETVLFTGSAALNTPEALTDKITNYKYIIVVFADQYNEIFTCVVPVSMVVLGTTAFMCGVPASSPINIKFSFVSGETVDSIKRESYTGTSTLKNVFGIN